MADDTVKKSRTGKPGGRKRAAKKPILHTAEIEPSSRRQKNRGVVLPLVRSGQPGTVALDNAKIFDIIPFP